MIRRSTGPNEDLQIKKRKEDDVAVLIPLTKPPLCEKFTDQSPAIVLTANDEGNIIEEEEVSPLMRLTNDPPIDLIGISEDVLRKLLFKVSEKQKPYVEVIKSKFQTILNGRGDIDNLIGVFEEVENIHAERIQHSDSVHHKTSAAKIESHLQLLRRFKQHSEDILVWLENQSRFIDGISRGDTCQTTNACCGYLLQNISLVKNLKFSSEKMIIENSFNIFKMACVSRSNPHVVRNSLALVLCYAEKDAKGCGSMFGGKPTSSSQSLFHFYTGTKASKSVRGRKYELLVNPSCRGSTEQHAPLNSHEQPFSSYTATSEFCFQDQILILRMAIEKKNSKAAIDSSNRFSFDQVSAADSPIKVRDPDIEYLDDEDDDVDDNTCTMTRTQSGLITLRERSSKRHKHSRSLSVIIDSNVILHDGAEGKVASTLTPNTSKDGYSPTSITTSPSSFTPNIPLMRTEERWELSYPNPFVNTSGGRSSDVSSSSSFLNKAALEAISTS